MEDFHSIKDNTVAIGYADEVFESEERAIYVREVLNKYVLYAFEWQDCRAGWIYAVRHVGECDSFEGDWFKIRESDECVLDVLRWFTA